MFENFLFCEKNKNNLNRFKMHLRKIVALFIIVILRYEIILTARLFCKHYINNQSTSVNGSTDLVSKNMDLFLEKIRLKCMKNMSESVYLIYYLKMYKGFEIKTSKLISI